MIATPIPSGYRIRLTGLLAKKVVGPQLSAAGLLMTEFAKGWRRPCEAATSGSPDLDEAMGTTLKARFTNGVLKPLEETGLKEGDEVTVAILNSPVSPGPEWLERTAGGWAGLVDGERLKEAIYESRALVTRPEPRLKLG